MDSILIVQVVSSVLFTIGIFVNYTLIKREAAKVAQAAEEAALLIRTTAEDVRVKLEEKAIEVSEKLKADNGV